MTYEEAKRARDQLDEQLKAACAVLKAIPGVGSGPMGLTPDAVKFSPAYRVAKAEVDRLFKQLRAANAFIAKHHRKDAAADRKARRSSSTAQGERP